MTPIRNASLFIDGSWRPAADGRRFIVKNPADGRRLASISNASSEDAVSAIDAASGAFPGWSKAGAKYRAELLRNCASLLIERRESLATLITRESGKPRRESLAEVALAAEYFRWFAEEGRRAYGEIMAPDGSGRQRLVWRRPMGVVGVITPWNLPLMIAARKIAPILAAGCTFILKPAEQTPLSAVGLFEVFTDAGLPPGAANLVTTSKPAAVGREFVRNDALAKITFTGSRDVGRRLAAGAGDRIKKISLELGGHAPFIVFKDADLETAVRELIVSKFRNSGQTCLAANRVYVHRTIYDKFRDRLLKKVSMLRVGDGMAPDSDIGPLIDRPTFDKVEAHVRDAIRRGARCLCGGGRKMISDCEKGLFFSPTVLDNAHDDMTVCREETFGPVIPLLAFDKEEDVVSRANRTPYGLAGYLFTRDMDRAIRVAQQLNFGIVGVNDGLPLAVECPFGGMKQSGIGREGGWQGLDEYLETKYCSIAPSSALRNKPRKKEKP